MDINNEPMINEEINDREVRLIGREGEQLGVMSLRAALDKAEEAGVDRRRGHAASPCRRPSGWCARATKYMKA